MCVTELVLYACNVRFGIYFVVEASFAASCRIHLKNHVLGCNNSFVPLLLFRCLQCFELDTLDALVYGMNLPTN